MNQKYNISYLDYNATTPIDPRVLDAMLPFLKENFANPSSTHYFGTIINEAVKSARKKVADLIGAEDREIIFTSGSTEGINIALKGVAKNCSNKGKHIITVSTEHKAVLDTCKDLEHRGFEITYLSVKSDGLVDLFELEQVIRPDTILISVMIVNNETGVIQPIKEISALAKKNGILFMTDGTQAVGKIEIDVNEWGIDLLSISGHKMYASKGIGALFVRDGIKLSTYTHGGGHENGIRSGTLNVPGIVSLGKACEIAKQEMGEDADRISILRNKLESKLLEIPNAFVNGSIENRVFNTTNICFQGQDANVLIGRMKNVAVSNGSACTAAIVEPSHVLSAMGLDHEDSFASIRFSLGKYNTEDDINSVIKNIIDLI